MGETRATEGIAQLLAEARREFAGDIERGRGGYLAHRRFSDRMDALVRQAAAPVRWVETIRCMAAEGATHILECGPGKVLAGLAKRVDANVRALALADRASLEQALASIKGS